MWKKIKTSKFYRSFNLDRATANEEDRTVELAFSSEDPYERYFGIEILDHGAGMDMSLISSGSAPLLKDHWRSEQIGVIDKAWVGSDHVGRARVRFSKSPLGEQEFQDVLDGIRSCVSVGYFVVKMILEKENKDKPDVYRVTEWKPVEASLVSIPADETVGVGKESEQIISTIIERSKNLTEVKTMDPEEIKKLEEAEKAKAKAKAEAYEKELREKAEKETQTEQTRVMEIHQIGVTYDLQDEAKKAIEEKTPLADFQKLLIDKMSERGFKPLDTSAPAGTLGMSDKDLKRFSMARFLRAVAVRSGHLDAAVAGETGFELDVATEAAKSFQKVTGQAAKGMIIPVDVVMDRRPYSADMLQRVLTAGTATDGAELVADELLAGSFIDVLRNLAVVANMGARLLPGLVGDILIPRKTSGSSAGWVSTETGNVANSEAQFDQVALTPKTLGSYSDISRQLLMQSSLAVDALIRDDLAIGVAIAMDLASLYGSGASGQPTGISQQTGINAPTAFAAAVPTYAEVVAMESAVAVDNALLGTLGYILEPAMRGSLKTTPKVSGYPVFIWEPDNTLNGYKTAVTSQITSGDLFFGNWADLIWAFWGGLDVLVDPYTGGLAGTIRFIVHQSTDIAVRHPVSFAFNNDGA